MDSLCSTMAAVHWQYCWNYWLSDFSKDLTDHLFCKETTHDKYEVKKFNAEFDQIISKINSHINSIQQDQIYKNDAVNSYSQTLSNFIVDLESSYSFLPHECTSYLKSIKSAVKQPIITSERWNNIAENLIRLRNFLEKEHNSHE